MLFKSRKCVRDLHVIYQVCVRDWIVEISRRMVLCVCGWSMLFKLIVFSKKKNNLDVEHSKSKFVLLTQLELSCNFMDGPFFLNWKKIGGFQVDVVPYLVRKNQFLGWKSQHKWHQSFVHKIYVNEVINFDIVWWCWVSQIKHTNSISTKSNDTNKLWRWCIDFSSCFVLNWFRMRLRRKKIVCLCPNRLTCAFCIVLS